MNAELIVGPAEEPGDVPRVSGLHCKRTCQCARAILGHGPGTGTVGEDEAKN